jgi:hypothetical protein
LEAGEVVEEILFWSSEVVCERRVFVWLSILETSRTLLPSYTDERQLAHVRAGSVGCSEIAS